MDPLGDQVVHVAVGFHPAVDRQHRGAEDFGALPFEDAGPDHGVHETALVLQGEEQGAAGGHRPLAHRHQAAGTDETAVRQGVQFAGGQGPPALQDGPQQRDRVGLVTIDSDVVDMVPPSAKHLDIVLHTIDRIRPGGEGSFEKPFLKIAEAIKRRSIVAVISDLYQEPREVLRAMSLLKNKGNDVLIFQVLDSAEIEFPFEGPMHFEDLETGERIPVVPERQRERYLELMRAHLGELSRLLVENRIDYFLFNTSQPLDHALFRYLTRREKLSRVR